MTTMRERSPWDPLFLQARREAYLIFGFWLAMLTWVVTTSYVLGYRPVSAGGQIRTIFGFPIWYFWGVFLPWLISSVIAILFCLCYMRDGDLDAESGIAASPAAAGSSKQQPTE